MTALAILAMDAVDQVKKNNKEAGKEMFGKKKPGVNKHGVQIKNGFLGEMLENGNTLKILG